MRSKCVRFLCQFVGAILQWLSLDHKRRMRTSTTYTRVQFVPWYFSINMYISEIVAATMKCLFNYHQTQNPFNNVSLYGPQKTHECAVLFDSVQLSRVQMTCNGSQQSMHRDWWPQQCVFAFSTLSHSSPLPILSRSFSLTHEHSLVLASLRREQATKQRVRRR